MFTVYLIYSSSFEDDRGNRRNGLISASWRTEVRTPPSQPGCLLNKRLFTSLFMFTVYVLYSASFDKIYIGFTNDLRRRFLFHNQLEKTGWTSRFRPWIVFYSEEYTTKVTAMRREKELKSAKGRDFIWKMIREK